MASQAILAPRKVAIARTTAPDEADRPRTSPTGSLAKAAADEAAQNAVAQTPVRSQCDRIERTVRLDASMYSSRMSKWLRPASTWRP